MFLIKFLPWKVARDEHRDHVATSCSHDRPEQVMVIRQQFIGATMPATPPDSCQVTRAHGEAREEATHLRSRVRWSRSSLTCTSFLMFFARLANLSVDSDSANASSAGDTQHSMLVRQLPPRLSSRMRVSLESRYGMCGRSRLSVSAAMTFPAAHHHQFPSLVCHVQALGQCDQLRGVLVQTEGYTCGSEAAHATLSTNVRKMPPVVTCNLSNCVLLCCRIDVAVPTPSILLREAS
jgi:hypothetical protein